MKDVSKKGRKSISDAQLQSVIRKELSKGNTTKTNCYELLRTKYKLTKSTFLKKFDEVHFDWARLKDKAESDGIVEVTKEAAKSGLKTKLDRLMILQTQVDELLADIKAASEKESKVSITDRAYLRKTLRDMQAEISKIEGDYAPEKRELSGNLESTVLILPSNGREVKSDN